MKRTLCLLVTLGILLPICSAASVKKLNYEIMVKGHRIGEVNVTESWVGKHRVIEISSQAKVKMLISFTISYDLKVVYENGELRFSSYHAYRSGRLHSATTVWRRSEHYEIKTDGEESQLDAPITYSGALLYFGEPGDTKRLFSEMDGHQKDLSRLGAGHYLVTNPKDEQETEYHYKDGILSSMLVHHRLMPFSIELRE